MSKYKTEQEKFWAGKFGDEYISRNSDEKIISANTILFGNILKSAPNIKSAVELGCNIGLNLRALNRIDPEFNLRGYEINEQAAEISRKLGIASIINGSIIEEIKDKEKYDLAFISCVLIHINPEYLDAVYKNLYSLSNKYIVISEYYNPTPTVVTYRGNDDKLFKRDFAGELIDKFNMKLIDYGFVYHRDNYAPKDDVNWFLLEK